jgi:hypothetical protein
MRQQADCSSKTSIEDCAGYKEQSPYTALLKDMETNYQCSGFCYTSPQNSTSPVLTIASLLQQDSRNARHTKKQDFPETETQNDYVGLLQGHVEQITVQAQGVGDSEAGIVVRAKHGGGSKSVKHNQLVSLLSAKANHSLPDVYMGTPHGIPAATISSQQLWNQETQGYGNTINNMEATGWMSLYPPTLFTNANYKVTCDGAVVRELQFGVTDVSNLMYLEGAVLLGASVLVGFMKIAVMCQRKEDSDSPPMNADEATQYHPYVKPSMAKQVFL